MLGTDQLPAADSNPTVSAQGPLTPIPAGDGPFLGELRDTPSYKLEQEKHLIEWTRVGPATPKLLRVLCKPLPWLCPKFLTGYWQDLAGGSRLRLWPRVSDRHPQGQPRVVTRMCHI